VYQKKNGMRKTDEKYSLYIIEEIDREDLLLYLYVLYIIEEK